MLGHKNAKSIIDGARTQKAPTPGVPFAHARSVLRVGEVKCYLVVEIYSI